MIALKCTQCGAGLEVESAQVETIGKVFTLHKETKIKCGHCGTEFFNEETFEEHVQTGGVRISSDGGNVTILGDVVGRSKTTVIRSTRND